MLNHGQKINHMKNEKKTLTQSQSQPQKPRLTYSEAMEMVQAAFASRNLLTKEPSTKSPQTKQDNTISVTFLKRLKRKKS